MSKFTAKGKFTVLAIVLTVILAMGLMIPAIRQTKAYTMDDLATLGEARTPDSLDPMKNIGWRSEAGLQNRNFESAADVTTRTEYGGPWSFAHTDEFGADNIDQVSSFRCVEGITDAVEEMGVMAGLGNKITTAIEITINKDNQNTLWDSLTYSQLDDMMWGEVAKEAFYFSAWVKAEQDMWFDVGISFGAVENHAQVYWDLGRRFFVPANTWTQIGTDGNGNYVPFRAKVTEDGFLRGTGSDPTAANSNCATADTYAVESKGDTRIEQLYRSAFGGGWACMRLYAYSGETYGTSGIGVPAANHGLKAGDKYLVTGCNFWQQSAQPPVVEVGVTGITLDKTTADMKVNDTLTLVATVTPENATNKNVVWTSSDETIATVDDNGLVTAKKNGTVTITATSDDSGDEATCVITIGESGKGGGCKGSIGAAGIAGISAICALGGLLLLKKRKTEN